MAFSSPGDDLTAIGTFSNPTGGKTLDCQSFGPKVQLMPETQYVTLRNNQQVQITGRFRARR